MTAAMYTGVPAPIRKWWVSLFKYLCILATGKSTPERADLDKTLVFFFPDLPDIVLLFSQKT